jgi:DNA-directed RNA polymerase subunit L
MSKTKQDPDISIKELSKVNYHVKSIKLESDSKKSNYEFKVPFHSKLSIDFKGKDVNHVLLNTLRRVAQDDLPTYAWCRESITINENSTIFNNDMMRLRLSQLPVLNTKLDLFYLDPVYWKGVNYADPKRPKHASEKLIEMQINIYNDTQNTRVVTTNDIRYYEDGEEIQNKYNKDCPVTLIELKPSDTFKCTSKAVLGVGEVNNIWSSVSNMYYDDHTTNEATGELIKQEIPYITLSIESQGQQDEYMILLKACKFIKKKIIDVKNEIDKRVKSKEINPEKPSIQLELVNEDHTIGELINYYFQNHKDIIFSGMAKTDHLIKTITIKISGKNIITAIFEQLDELYGTYDFIESKLSKMSGLKLSDNEKVEKKK